MNEQHPPTGDEGLDSDGKRIMAVGGENESVSVNICELSLKVMRTNQLSKETLK